MISSENEFREDFGGISRSFVQCDLPEPVYEQPVPEPPPEKERSFPYNDIYKKKPKKGEHFGGTLIGCLLTLALIAGVSMGLYKGAEKLGYVESDAATGQVNTQQTTPETFLPGAQDPSFAAETSDPAHIDKTNTEFDPGTAYIEIESGHGPELTPEKVYESVSTATTLIVNVVADGSGTRIGTGVIIDPNGFIITNQHVVDNYASLRVILTDNSIYSAELVAENSEYDLAILKVEAKNLPTVVFGNSDDVRVGEPAYAIGNPINLDLRSTFTTGVISAKDRLMSVDGVGTMVLIQTDAALNNGNSGGPLINEYGQVIGINSSKISTFSSAIEGLGFAIPSNTVKDVVNTLLSGSQPEPDFKFGLVVETIGIEIEPGLFGLRVQTVMPGSLGEKAGIVVGDYLLTADGQPLHMSHELVLIRKAHKVGDEIPFEVYRNGKTETLKMTIE